MNSQDRLRELVIKLKEKGLTNEEIKKVLLNPKNKDLWPK